MTRRVLIIDIDDTLADTKRHLLRLINARSTRQYHFEDEDRSTREGGDPEYDTHINAILASPEQMMGIEPFADALSSVRRLHDAGYELHIVSSRREPLLELTVSWLAEHGFSDFITTVHRRGNERGTEFKARIAGEIGAIAAFDDTFDVGQSLAAAGLTVYLIDKPWNNEVDLPSGMIRVDSFSDGVTTFLAAAHE